MKGVSGIDVQLRDEGTLILAITADDCAHLMHQGGGGGGGGEGASTRFANDTLKAHMARLIKHIRSVCF